MMPLFFMAESVEGKSFREKNKERLGKVDSASLTFAKAFKYPFNRALGMLNVLWLLLPIIGWFAFGGYTVRIVREWVDGKFEELPLFSFGDDFKLGFFMFLKAIPFVLVYFLVSLLLGAIPGIGGLLSFMLEILVLPILGINFLKKGTVQAYFEFEVVGLVFANFLDYVVALLKALGLFLVFFILIIVLVGIPGLAFTWGIFVADFYRRYSN